uniref:Uncharacterized protein n=1 Tax=Anguilla anguilla TaxID=7936 RepID=A0A0E9TBT3_ANGAN
MLKANDDSSTLPSGSWKSPITSRLYRGTIWSTVFIALLNRRHFCPG